MTPAILPIEPSDLDAASPLLLLNNAHAEQTSFLTAERMAQLAGQAFLACHIGADAFLIALDQDADYDSPNFLWFRERFARFVYIDRVLVHSASRGRGLARMLYEALFQRALQAGHEHAVCEVNLEPPNPASNAFHAALGFEPVGSAVLPVGGKTVCYFSRPLP